MSYNITMDYILPFIVSFIYSGVFLPPLVLGDV